MYQGWRLFGNSAYNRSIRYCYVLEGIQKAGIYLSLSQKSIAQDAQFVIQVHSELTVEQYEIEYT